MTEPAIVFENVVKNYGKHNVLSDVSLTINQGDYVGLVGLNGAGKTTLIKCLLDFVSLTQGNIQIFGLPHINTNSRDFLSFLPEKFLPPYYLTGKDFLFYMAELNQIKIKESDLEAMCHSLDLDISALSKSVRQYSKGMAQKLGLIACFISQRKLLLFDEPMSGLDPKARAYLKQHLLQLKESGVTLFFSTHLFYVIWRTGTKPIITPHDG